MDKITHYKKIVREVQEIVANLGSKPNAIIEIQVIQDDQRGQYLIYSNGWYDPSHNRVYGNYFHVQVKDDGKVWLHHDGTDLIIAEMLEERGIPKEDIVLAFHAPIRRPDTGYAVA